MFLNRACVWMCVSACMVISTSFINAESLTRDAVSKVELLLTTAPTLSRVARSAMIEEAAEIWERQGVAIDWLSATIGRPSASNRLRGTSGAKPAGEHDRTFVCRGRAGPHKQQPPGGIDFN